MSKTPALMIQGCTSNAGKSYLTSGFCRYFANQGLKVAPFKAQNMSNNAGVTPKGLEMGRAQLLQAQAAKITPDVRMNPVLLKPEADTLSQVVVMGEARPDLKEIPWLERKRYLWQHVQTSLHSLMEDVDLVVIEGAGSPAEINLRASDIVNMSVALEAEAKVLIAADIDHGGAFAHLLGTWHCLEQNEKDLVLGFLVNKFRGDPKLLGNAMDWLEERTQVPTLGVVPMLRLALPEEDAFSLIPEVKEISAKAKVAIVMTPFISNFDEFDSLLHEPNIEVVWVKTLADLEGADAVILAGSKQVAADLDYLKRSGVAAKIHKLASQGVMILGICGGFQMLGMSIQDSDAVESSTTEIAGLGLLDVQTHMKATKVTRQSSVKRVGSQLELKGYEIHHGETVAGTGVSRFLSDGLGFQQGNVTGVYVHGLFDNTGFRVEWLEKLGVEGNAEGWLERTNIELDKLANHLSTHCDMQSIEKALNL